MRKAELEKLARKEFERGLTQILDFLADDNPFDKVDVNIDFGVKRTRKK